MSAETVAWLTGIGHGVLLVGFVVAIVVAVQDFRGPR